MKIRLYASNRYKAARSILMRVLVIAGGTGGHIYPALSIAKEFKQIKNEIFWIGKRKGLEEKICNEEGFNFFRYLNYRVFRKRFFSKLKSLYFLFLGSHLFSIT